MKLPLKEMFPFLKAISTLGLLLVVLSNTLAQSLGDPRFLLGAYDFLIYDRENLDIIKKHGERVQIFLQEMGKGDNGSFLKSAEGIRLLDEQVKLINFLKIQNAFAEGLKDEGDDRRGLSSRFLDASGGICPEGLACSAKNTLAKEKLFVTPGLSELVKDLTPVVEGVAYPDMAQTLVQSSFPPLLKSYIHFLIRLHPEVLSLSPERVADDLCLGEDHQEKNICQDGMKEELLEQIKSLYDGKMNLRDKIPYGDMAKDINKRISSLNLGLKKIEEGISVKGGKVNLGVWSSSDPIFNQSSLVEYRRYVQEYLGHLSEGAGVLLLSSSVREKAGGLKDMQSDLKKERPYYFSSDNTSYRYAPHQEVDDLDVTAGILDIRAQMISEIRDLIQFRNEQRKMKSSLEISANAISRSKEQVKQLMLTAPLKVGEMLMKNPEFAPYITDLIKEISSKDRYKSVGKKAFIIGGAIMSGVLLVSGIGTMAGVSLIPFLSASAGATTVGTITSVAGLAVKAGQVGYSAKSAQDSYAEQLKLESSYLMGVGDIYNLTEAQEQLQNFHSSKVDMAATLGLSLLDFTNILSAANAAVKMSQASIAMGQTSLELSRLNNSLSPILNNKKYSDLILRIKLSKSFPHGQDPASKEEGSSYTAKFLGTLCLLSQDNLDSFLNLMSSWNGEEGLLEGHIIKSLDEIKEKSPISSEEIDNLKKAMIMEGILGAKGSGAIGERASLN